MTDNLINALIKAQQEIDHVVQDGNNPFFKSDYATLKEVIDSVKKPLNDNGILLQQESHNCDNGACVETIFYGHGGKISTGRVTITAFPDVDSYLDGLRKILSDPQSQECVDSFKANSSVIEDTYTNLHEMDKNKPSFEKLIDLYIPKL